MLASPAIESPEMVATANGRNSGSSTASAVSATNSPLPGIASRNGGPPPPVPQIFTATAISTGTAARVASPAMLRRRVRINRSSEPSSTNHRLTADIEALTGQSDEHVLQAGGADPERVHGHLGGDQ